MPPSPLLAGAKRATVFYDHRARKWSTVIVRGSLSTIERHLTEQAARAHVGLEGGSPDPYFTPRAGDTTHTQETAA